MLVLKNMRIIVKSEKLRKRTPYMIPLPGEKNFFQVNIAVHFQNISMWYDAAM